LSGKAPQFKAGICAQTGTARGTLLPINLSVLMRLAGTPYFPDLRGVILVLEDVHERVHKIDLMLQQLKQQPHFNALAGLVFGQWTDCTGDAEDGTIDDCINDFLQDVHVPVIKNFNFGHTPERFVLPLGIKAQIDAAQTELKILAE
jgi:muramoyltetrapeptide carboxypeptidase